MSEIQFREAETAHEFEQIHRLNHRVFAEEIGQHGETADGHLVDRFHASNRYFIAVEAGEVVGMVSAHADAEFSVASRLPDPSVLRRFRAPLEVRLLAILPEYRQSLLLPGLLLQVHGYATRHGFSDLLISGIATRLSLYEKIGFRALGPAVTCGAAQFVPMHLSLDAPPSRFVRLERLYATRFRGDRSEISLLPGPVEIAPAVTRAFHGPPVSHRSSSFVAEYEETRSRLSVLMGGMHTVLLGGSGTLANDAVAANLHAVFAEARGLVVANGEFGERLTRQAARAGLRFDTLRFDWGTAWDFDAIGRALDKHPAWIWAVHLETSTGVVNDLPRLLRLAESAGVAVAADCVSSLGAVDTREAGNLFLGSGVAGKALGSYAGLSFVFASSSALERLAGKQLCPTFDLAQAAAQEGPVSTVSTPLVSAVCEALRQNFFDAEACDRRFEHHRELGTWIRARIRELGLNPLAAEQDAAPTITSFPLPSPGFAGRCERAGFRIAHESEYLRTRGWGQIATMGNVTRASLEPLFEGLKARIPTLPER
ncbi:MAG TPA: aminotransferase class V-fold PLP-dependent enzyme [Terracidiphilus sp.]|nr:aminotransferase class V-fold PLP-dependent enzyme [Terracidiphilus sp.]